MRHLVVLLTALLLAPASARANPFNLPDNCIIEGSTRHGGMQPDYLVGAGDRDLTRLMSYAEKIGGSSRLDFWQKVERIRTRVKNSMPHREYDDPTYLDLIKRYRERGKPIPMGQYCKYGVGVCRENAILLTMALNRAGISSKFVYARVQVGPDRRPRVRVPRRGPRRGRQGPVDDLRHEMGRHLLQVFVGRRAGDGIGL